jgi:hypothetical protein
MFVCLFVCLCVCVCVFVGWLLGLCECHNNVIVGASLLVPFTICGFIISSFPIDYIYTFFLL